MKKKINAKFIRTLDPCKSGIDNFEKHYLNFNGTLEELLMLENISYSDKIWLVTKIVDYKTLQQWSLDCVTFVVDNYNKEYPNDNTLNEVLETIKRVLLGELDRSAARSAARSAESAAWSAARSARSARSAARSAESAARSAESAAWSAESAAYSAESAARSAESAAWSAESAAYSAAWSARSARSEKEQEGINISLLIALL